MVGSGGDRRFGLERPEVVEAIVRDAVPEEWRNEEVGEAALEQAISLYEQRMRSD